MTKLFVGFLNTAQLAALHDAGHAIEQFAVSEVQKAVGVLKTTSIGATVVADIAAAKDTQLSGAQKFEQVFANTVPLVLKYVTGGGVEAVEADVADIARELVQSTYNDVLATKAGSIATAILDLFKGK